MADSSRRYLLPAQNLDLGQILQEAQHRWLRPAEICEILRNYRKFKLNPEPPTRPPAGSLFLFDRKALRYFRKDGHRWRKKKDGKTIKEAHEKLKAGNVDALHCYYAHGEDNEYFQRRSYWMLDGQLEHIVLVHYREVNAGYKSGLSRFLVDPGTQDEGHQTSSVSCFLMANHPVSNAQTSYPDTTILESSGQLIPSKLEDVDSVGSLGPFTLATAIYQPSQHSPFLKSVNAELPAPSSNQNLPWLASGGDKVSSHAPVLGGNQLSDANYGRDQERLVDHRFYHIKAGTANFLAPKLSDTGLEAEGKALEASSLSRHMQLNTDSQDELFSISDFSPDWAYSGVETKVLIVGTFLPNKDRPKWVCMFGETEVSALILTDTSMRCIAPLHSPGRVPFYVTCNNRMSCSQVREFEYRVKPSAGQHEETHLQIRLAKLLYLSEENHCPVEKCDKCELKVAKEADTGGEVCRLEQGCPKDAALQSLFRNRLGQWLVYKVHQGSKGLHILDEEGQGVIHLAAALGYWWAMTPIISAGISPNYRDAHGRTGLHWASYFGREETVIALIQHGADPGLVDDPTSAFRAGQTAADLASSRGRKGIAGYLAEADLTGRLSILNAGFNVADAANETASQVVSSSGGCYEELSLKASLAAVRKSSHAAALIQASFRARSFRQRQQLIQGVGIESEVSTDLIALGYLKKVEKVDHFVDYLHSAAIRIQQKYRGWKGRKEFLKLRNRIVKFQDHVRGHQVRKEYKKVVWSVSIVEKAILRWRRKRVGLRAFRVDNSKDGSRTETDEYDFLSIGRKQKLDGVERALARVKSMVRDPIARDQYMRMVSKFSNCKMDNDSTSATQ